MLRNTYFVDPQFRRVETNVEETEVSVAQLVFGLSM